MRNKFAIKLKNILKKYYFIRLIVRFLRNYILTIPTEFLVLMRRYNIYSNKKFYRLKELRNKYWGKRCFIVCTGPSLTIKDLEFIKEEICFSMNSAIKILDKTNWRPQFYGIQDKRAYKELKNKVLEYNNEIYYIFKPLYLKEFKDSSNTIYFPLNLLGHEYSKENNRIKFSENAYYCVYDGFTITYSLIQIAIYMGFKNIYLLGCDANYTPINGKIHFIEYDNNVFPLTKESEELRHIFAYKQVKEYIDDHPDIKIYNATKGGNLDIFERVKLESILLEK
ncbi:hypothetical protein EZS27_010185 [termite gut metagenome]|uniref:6-hydroxymethylpterin diphosphokinase MptE-like domain-containing protein n=1 Tax=termite gut metagenome TaxID=433724 RepID=A0A5J4S7E8_9ZZZZ